jgi:hypothetical protein
MVLKEIKDLLDLKAQLDQLVLKALLDLTVLLDLLDLLVQPVLQDLLDLKVSLHTHKTPLQLQELTVMLGSILQLDPHTFTMTDTGLK